MAKQTTIFGGVLEARLAEEKKRHNEAMLALLDQEIARLNGLRQKITGLNGSTRAGAFKHVGRAKRTRSRRDPLSMKKLGEKVLGFVKSKGEAGATSIEILEQKFGKLGPSIPKFVEKYTGVKMKHKGPARGRKYFHS